MCWCTHWGVSISEQKAAAEQPFEHTPCELDLNAEIAISTLRSPCQRRDRSQSTFWHEQDGSEIPPTTAPFNECVPLTLIPLDMRVGRRIAVGYSNGFIQMCYAVMPMPIARLMPMPPDVLRRAASGAKSAPATEQHCVHS